MGVCAGLWMCVGRSARVRPSRGERAAIARCVNSGYCETDRCSCLHQRAPTALCPPISKPLSLSRSLQS
eukprot:scaffold257837_cov33-Tisochrysis_lutea.AAC.7